MQENKRNSFIEFYRFLLAFWLAFSHGFFPGASGGNSNNFSHFQHGGMSVTMFFTICGFFLVPAIMKQNDKPFCKGLLSFTRQRVKSLGLIAVVGLACQIGLCIFAYKQGDVWNKDHTDNIFEYIWYVATAGSVYWFLFGMIVSSMFFFVLYRICKRRIKLFLLPLPLLIFYGYFIRFYNYGIDSGMAIFSSLAGMSMGILLSYIPHIRCNTTIKFSFVVITFLSMFYISYLPKTDILSPLVVINIFLFLILLYFSNQIDLPKESIARKVFLYLGSLSIPLYIGQAIIVVVNINTLSWGSIFFILLCAICIINCKQQFMDIFKKPREIQEHNVVNEKNDTNEVSK